MMCSHDVAQFVKKYSGLFSCCIASFAGATFVQASALAQTPQTQALQIEDEQTEEVLADVLVQVPSVSQLSDVQPDDWAYQALVNLTERYDILSGYPDGTFQGNRTLTRYEFAAALNQVLAQLQTLIAILSDEDLAMLERLQIEFSPELLETAQQIDELEVRSQQIEAQQVSPVIRLNGQLIMAATAGNYGGDQIVAPLGALVTDQSPDAFFLNRVALLFNASFTGEDLLQIRLVSGSNGPNDNVAGSLEPNFGSTLDYATQGRNNNFSIARAYYSFNPVSDLNVVVGPQIVITDFVDTIRTNPSSADGFSTQAFTNNFVLFPSTLGGGGVLDWNPNSGDFSLRAAYVAGSADESVGEDARIFSGQGGADGVMLFPIDGGSEQIGLFGDPNQGLVELEYAPADAFALKLQYAGGQIFGSDFEGFGASAEVALSSQLALFGRYGYSRYDNTTVGNITPQYWMAGATYADVFKKSDLSGVAVGQPFIEGAVGNATQTNFEAFYSFPVNRNITVAPFTQVVVNPANRDENGTITVGGVRTVFSF